MRTTTFKKASDIYEITSKYSIYQHSFYHPDMAQFFYNLKRFDEMLGEERQNELWRPLLKELRRARFELISAPLSFKHQRSRAKWLRKESSKVGIFSPQSLESYISLIDILFQLSSFDENPILRIMIEQCNHSFASEAGIVLKDARLLERVEQLLLNPRQYRDLFLLTENHLKAYRIYEKLIVIGLTHWFPSYIFNSPRSKEIHVINFQYVSDQLPTEADLLNAPGKIHRIYSGCHIHTLPKRTFNSEVEKKIEDIQKDLEFENDLLPVIEIDWGTFRSRVTSLTEKEPDITEARLFLLSEGKAVYLEEGDSKKLVLDVESARDQSIKRMPVSKLQVGHYILLRTERGGDLVAIVADRILGAKAQTARKKQVLWKQKLRDHVNINGIHSTVRKLTELGSKIANDLNVRNWMSERLIRPKAVGDFKAIMKLTGLVDQSDDLSTNARLIDAAHLRAGQRIRSLLIKQVLKSDLDLLDAIGTMIFEIPGYSGGSITAYRIEGVSPSVITVPASYTQIILDRDDV